MRRSRTRAARAGVLLALLFLLALGPVGGGGLAQDGSGASGDEVEAPKPVILLRGLDKVTARVSPIEMHVDEPGRFGSLEITVRSCHKAPPEDPPESAAFLEIRELRPGESPVELFSGWMFASSPAFSTLEHAVYDVWVIDCAAPPASG
jgi:hypothetical protein